MQDSFDLTTIGATDAIFEAFQPYTARGLMLARVSVVHGDRYRLYTAQGEMQAEAIGALLYRTDRSAWPAVGDWVAVQPVGPDDAMVHAVLPRRTMFSRRAAGDREQEQVIAANIDLALIDGWPGAGGPSLALEVMQVLAPQMRMGAIAVNDNAEEDYLDFIRNPKGWFRSMTLPLKGGTEVSVKAA